MGRMHNNGKGISRRSLPYSRQAPSWTKTDAKTLKDQIFSMARKGFFPSQIGLVLRDSHAVTQTSAITGTKVLRILKAGGLGPRLPEDLYHMIKKAVTIRKHLSVFRKDKDAKFRLILVESRIHRLARYYRSKRQLPPNWRYESGSASTLVA